MRKLGSGGLKWLKIVHLIFIILMLGGIISSVVFIGQTLFGIFFIDSLTTKNLNLLAAEKSAALTNPAFIHNQSSVLYGAFGQIMLIICLICISVFKPWGIKK